MFNKNNFFNFEDKNEGNVSIGKIPEHLHTEIDYIEKTFYDDIPIEYKKKITYHKWYSELNDNLKSKIDYIKNDSYWKNLCNKNECKLIRIDDMDEIYYANPPKTTSSNLYGAVGNYYIHRDGHFNFLGVKIYRVLIGVTDDNKNIMTYLTNLNYGKPLNKYEYLAFDFDKTTHQVLKNNNGDEPKYRIVLKLHFLVCENCSLPNWYIRFLLKFYTYYLKITRYVMENGTNPKTLPDFFFGVLSYIIGVNFNILLSIFIFFIILFILYIKNNKVKSYSNLILKSFIICIFIFISIVLYEYLYFILTKYNKELN
jgi:hypothetical protein